MSFSFNSYLKTKFNTYSALVFSIERRENNTVPVHARRPDKFIILNRFFQYYQNDVRSVRLG